MGGWILIFSFMVTCLFVLFQTHTCMASSKAIGRLKPGFQGAQSNFIDENGMFLFSNNSIFGFGFTNSNKDVLLFVLAIVHLSTETIVWSANRDNPVRNTDKFVLNDDGNAILQSGGYLIWSTALANKGVFAMELQDSGNLVLLGNDDKIVWQSFDYPVNSLLSNQEFRQGMKLVSNPSTSNLTYSLEINSGDLLLYANFRNPQPYWSSRQDSRTFVQNNGQDVSIASLVGNTWRFYDKNRVVLWQIYVSDHGDTNSTWIATLEDEGYITFYGLQSGSSNGSSPIKIPADSCSRPEICKSYEICYYGNQCVCPSVLVSKDNCRPDIVSPCNESESSMELINAGDGLSYFALGLVAPSSKTNLDGCKSSCLANCSCLAMFFEQKSQNCFHFDTLGNLQGSDSGSNFVSFIKVSRNISNVRDPGEHRGSKKNILLIVTILLVTTMVIVGVLYAGIRYYQNKNKVRVECPQEEDEDIFLGNMSGRPIRFSHYDLQVATNNFSRKLGQGGFGSVYEGVLSDGTRLAVKQLEGIGQGKKEFQAEISSIGSIHHLHLVRLKGFCTEGAHRLLVYEYMANGSLERWIFNKHGEDRLDWDTRYDVALGTARGLAYLHENCDVKIVHCDVKPENVLLDEKFVPKVSDFGLAKLMSREQSHVFTKLRGTRGYLAPEWITNSAISEKSDVYSYGMLLLEMIGGRRNYYASETEEQCNFPLYAFKMMEQGKLKDIVDVKLRITEEDERVAIAIKVALWCIQDDMQHRPSMKKVVKMLEQVSPVPPPPSSQRMVPSRPLDVNSCAHLSGVRLSGPR